MTLRPCNLALSFGIVGACLLPFTVRAAERRVASPAELRAALAGAQAGAVIAMAPGEYGGGYDLRAVSGTAAAPVVIRAADPKNPPTFTGGRFAFRLPGDPRLGWRLAAGPPRRLDRSFRARTPTTPEGRPTAHAHGFVGSDRFHQFRQADHAQRA